MTLYRSSLFRTLRSYDTADGGATPTVSMHHLSKSATLCTWERAWGTAAAGPASRSA